MPMKTPDENNYENETIIQWCFVINFRDEYQLAKKTGKKIQALPFLWEMGIARLADDIAQTKANFVKLFAVRIS